MGMLGQRKGSVRLGGPRADRPAGARHRPGRHRHLPRGARHLRQPLGRGEPDAAAAGARRAGSRSSASSSSSPTSGSGCRARAPSSRAASSRCWRSAASCAPAPSCCCSTSRPRASRRSSSSRSADTIARLKQEGFTIVLVEQNFHFAASVADRHYVVEHGRVIDMIPQRGARRQHRQAARLPRRLTAVDRMPTEERDSETRTFCALASAVGLADGLGRRWRSTSRSAC